VEPSSQKKEKYMIECRFVFRAPGMGASDSLNTVYQVQAVPKVGETISLSNGADGYSTAKVNEVAHYINTSTGKHEVTVYYS
jgi:hypothetical protein